MRKILLVAAAASAFAFTACDAAKEAASKALGDMTLKGTVQRANSDTAIEGATVRAIPLLDATAIQQLIEYRKVPDGAGGQKDQIRIKLDKVQNYAGEKTDATTDASGKFSMEVPLNVYLVYTFGPGEAPGSATAYSVHFWGINPETGELDMDHLIGADKKLEQVNDDIELAGGPVPPSPDTPVPAAPPGPPTDVPTPTADVETAPTAPDATRPEEIVPPAATAAFWKSIDLAYGDEGKTLGTTSNVWNSAEEVLPATGERYMTLKAELTAAQTEPVYLVIQTGFDSTRITGCDTAQSAAQAHVYPVTPNGTMVEYKLVSPGSYYRLFFAKTATETEGAPIETTDATQGIEVGERNCANAAPERPFLATLTWNRESDVDLHVLKYDAAKVAAGQTGEALVDQANWTRREGESLSLDVDNTWANGPENNGESKDVLDPNAFCYVVQLHLYSKSGEAPVEATVHVMHVAVDGAVKKVNQYEEHITLNNYGEWKPVGIYGPADCSKLTETAAAGSL